MARPSPDHIVVIGAGAAGLTGNADMGFIRGSSDLVEIALQCHR
jgi:hypothetical protein